MKRAYRKLARENPPDANPGDSRAEDTFKPVSEADAVRSDP
ncbi:MAG: DnaJ domain-containing protein, partial [Rhodococcus sp. (in: high G+C Gram-positive bacteria)]